MENRKSCLYTLDANWIFRKPTIARNFQDEGFDRVDFEEVADVCD
jgi:threonylcarbamoyladenosine tRNA methylthiotransferase MtaB